MSGGVEGAQATQRRAAGIVGFILRHDAMSVRIQTVRPFTNTYRERNFPRLVRGPGELLC